MNASADSFERRPPLAPRCVDLTNPFIRFDPAEIEQSIPARFEQQVATHPDRLAFKAGPHSLTYGALNRLANRVAHAILARSRAGQEPILLVLEHGAAAVAAILGVLKAGKLYVPLDPAVPRERNKYIVGDSQARLVVSNSRNMSLASDLAGDELRLIALDELDSSLPSENPELSISPDALTWIIYTSGTTGQPKGVVQNHRNVLHYVMNYTNALHICEDDRLSLLFSYGVNAGAHEIFSALLNGASLHSLDVRAEGPARLVGWLNEEKVSLYSSVPTLFRHFTNTLGGAETFRNVRVVKLVGEAVSRRDLEAYRRYFPPTSLLVNRLGSTETGSICWYFMNSETRIQDNRVPIGHSVTDNEVLILDEVGAQVRSGEVGEIVVRSQYLSPGYWRRPDLTRAAFLPDPEGGDTRLFRTGDLGYRLPDGRLVHVGRKDFQVKVRGHRIELDEVEHALLEIETVKEAVVVARANGSHDQRLVAYVVPKGQTAPTTSALRRALAEKLPDYMIPAAFVALQALPLAPNGKLDRQGLPDPDRARPTLDEAYVAPHGPVQELLATLWAEVLNLDHVGINDNFMELGGDSLQAARLLSRVRDSLQIDLPLEILFRAPTVAKQTTALLEHAIAADPGGELAARLAELPVTPIHP
jgi:amino acid adenylation domain-containing protein